MSLIVLQFGIPGGQEMMIILLIAVLLFGANKIPKLARSTGQAMGEFQKGRQQVEDELEDMKEGTPMEEGAFDDDTTSGSSSSSSSDSDSDSESSTSSSSSNSSN
ncbi:MAG: twin-arginine translocase TatA/TatE family subunit [Haloarculaceae archaeon]